MDQAAAHRAAVADLEVADQGHRRCQQRIPFGETGVALNRPLARHRADADAAIAIGVNAVQTGNAVHVHDHRRTGQTQAHERHQALSAGEDLAVVAVLVEQMDCLVQGFRTVVAERCGFHGDGRAFSGCVANYPRVVKKTPCKDGVLRLRGARAALRSGRTD